MEEKAQQQETMLTFVNWKYALLFIYPVIVAGMPGIARKALKAYLILRMRAGLKIVGEQYSIPNIEISR